jgi:predicted nucleic acid-binding protein
MLGRDFVDTNVLVYAVDESEPAKRDVARAILAADDAARRLVLSTQVLCEFYVVTTRRLDQQMPTHEAAAAVGELSKLAVVGSDVALVEDGIRLSIEAQLSLWDALIVAAAKIAGCARVLTEDLSAGVEIESVLIENPFAGVAVD